jgi:hypothetical protein
MRVFDTDTDRDYARRFNVIDENNVLVGFSMGSSCCESFGHFFTPTLPAAVDSDTASTSDAKFDHGAYVFDPSFKRDLPTYEHDDGGAVAFRLVSKDGGEMFLVLYNHHNGYYSHGFDMKQGETVLYEGAV